ncbi:MAG: hypothetical protein LBV45_08320, partial [Xanthomonadaceae bacterium]|nr:hypothetical protein [Xanthomonadaceae bacterium]
MSFRPAAPQKPEVYPPKAGRYLIAKRRLALAVDDRYHRPPIESRMCVALPPHPTDPAGATNS